MLLEDEMRAPVNLWLEGMGLEPHNEYRICWRIPDVIGVKGKRIEIAVEMKISDWRGALRQASAYTMFSVHSYVAMPSSKQALVLRHIRDFRGKGVGVLMVGGDGTVTKLIESAGHEAAFSYASPP